MKKDVSRREFAENLTKLLLFGGLTHFALANSAHAATSQEEAYKDCPGGLAPVDVCNPPKDYDYCPGEKEPTDECPPNGERPEDVCRSGLAEADICDPSQEKISDNCTTGDPINDLCPKDDKCWSGIEEDDYCPPDYSLKAGDECPGGGSEYIGKRLDICLTDGTGKMIGDECPKGTWGDEDDCKSINPDRCAAPDSIKGLFDDDTCLSGKNYKWQKDSDGYGDWCTGGILASDSCWSGKDEDDLCEDNGGSHGEYDECPGGDSKLDKCGVVGFGVTGALKTSDDYCVTGKKDSDECPDGKPPEDECVGGIPSEDVCYMHTAGSDECDRNTAGSDQSGCKEWSDTCFIFDKCNVPAWSSKDIAE